MRSSDPYESAFAELTIAQSREGRLLTRASNGVTSLEYAAIHLRAEHPNLPAWLNEMIRKSRRDEFAKAAIAGYAVDETEALKFADAFIDTLLKEDGK